MRAAGRIVYRTIAFNRRIVAPTPSAIRCACDPDPNPIYNALLRAVLYGLSAGGLLVALALTAELRGGRSGLSTLVAPALLAPAALAGIAGAFSRSVPRLATVQHWLWVLAAGALPWLAAGAIRRFVAPPTLVPVAAVVSAAMVAFEVRRRWPHLRLGRASRDAEP